MISRAVLIKFLTVAMPVAVVLQCDVITGI